MQRQLRPRWCHQQTQQRVQNALARTVMMTEKRDHVTPVLARLHWLPVTARIQFRIALLTFKTLTTHQPSYIHAVVYWGGVYAGIRRIPTSGFFDSVYLPQ